MALGVVARRVNCAAACCAGLAAARALGLRAVALRRGRFGGRLAASPAAADLIVVAAPTIPQASRQGSARHRTYHVLWELVHVFFEHPGACWSRGPSHDHSGMSWRGLHHVLG